MVTINMEAPDDWVEAADERDISVVEYTRRMVRAGQRQFGIDYEASETPAEPQTLKLDETTRSDIDTQLKHWIHANLSVDNAHDIEDLIELLDDDLSRVADDLCDEGKAKYRRSEGGYLKIPVDE